MRAEGNTHPFLPRACVMALLHVARKMQWVSFYYVLM